MNDILRIARLRIALQRAFLGRAILRVIFLNVHSKEFVLSVAISSSTSGLLEVND